MTTSVSHIFTESDVWDGEEVDNKENNDKCSVEHINNTLSHETNKNVISKRTNTQSIPCSEFAQVTCGVSLKIKRFNTILEDIAHRVQIAYHRIGLSEADVVDKWNEFTDHTLITFLQHYAEDIEAEEQKWAQENYSLFRKLIALCTYLHYFPQEQPLQQILMTYNNNTDNVQAEENEEEIKTLSLTNEKLVSSVMETCSANKDQNCIMETASFTSHSEMKTILLQEYEYCTSVAHKRFAMLLLLHRLHQVIRRHTFEFMQMGNKTKSLTHEPNSCDKSKKPDKVATFYDFDMNELFTGCFMLYKLDIQHQNDNSVDAMHESEVTLSSSSQLQESLMNDATVLEYDKNKCNCQEKATPLSDVFHEIDNTNESEEVTTTHNSLMENEQINSLRSSMQYASALSSRASSCIRNSRNLTTDKVNNQNKITHKIQSRMKNDDLVDEEDKEKMNLVRSSDDDDDDEDEQLQLLLMTSIVEDELNDPRGMSYCLQPRQTVLSSESVNKKHHHDNSSNNCNCITSINSKNNNICNTASIDINETTRQNEKTTEVKTQKVISVSEQEVCNMHNDKTSDVNCALANVKCNVSNSSEADNFIKKIVWRQQKEVVLSLVKSIDVSSITNQKLEQNLSVERMTIMTQEVHDALEQYNSVLQHASRAQLDYIRSLIDKEFIEKPNNDTTDINHSAQEILAQRTDASRVFDLAHKADNLQIVTTAAEIYITLEKSESCYVDETEINNATIKDSSSTMEQCIDTINSNDDDDDIIEKSYKQENTKVQESMQSSTEEVMQIIQQHILQIQNSKVKLHNDTELLSKEIRTSEIYETNDSNTSDNSSCKSTTCNQCRCSSGSSEQIIYDIITECKKNLESKAEEREQMCAVDDKMFDDLPDAVRALFSYRLHCREWQFLLHITLRLEEHLITRYKERIHNLHNKLNDVQEEEYLLTGIRYNYYKNEHNTSCEYNKLNIQEAHNHQSVHLEKYKDTSVEIYPHESKSGNIYIENTSNSGKCSGDDDVINTRSSNKHIMKEPYQVNEMKVNVHCSSILIQVEQEIMSLEKAWEFNEHKLVLLRNAHELIERRSKLLGEEEELRVHSRDRLLSKKINMAKQLLYEESVRRRIRRELPTIHAELAKIVQEWRNMFVNNVINDENKPNNDNKVAVQQWLYIHGVNVEELVSDIASKGNVCNNITKYKLTSRSRSRCDDNMTLSNNKSGVKLLTLNNTNNNISNSYNAKTANLSSTIAKCNDNAQEPYQEEYYSIEKTKLANTRSATPYRGNKLQPLSCNNNTNTVSLTRNAKLNYTKQNTRSATPQPSLHHASSSLSSLTPRWNTNVHSYLPHTSHSNNEHSKNNEKENLLIVNKETPFHEQTTIKPLSMPSRSTSVSSIQSHLSRWHSNTSTPVSRANRMKYFVPTRKAKTPSAKKQINDENSNATTSTKANNSINTFSKPTVSSATKCWSKTQVTESTSSVDKISSDNSKNTWISRTTKDKNKEKFSAVEPRIIEGNTKTDVRYLHKRKREDEMESPAATIIASITKTPVTDRCLQTELCKKAQESNEIKSAEVLANVRAITSKLTGMENCLQASTIKKDKWQKLESSCSPAPRTPSHVERD